MRQPINFNHLVCILLETAARDLGTKGACSDREQSKIVIIL